MLLTILNGQAGIYIPYYPRLRHSTGSEENEVYRTGATSASGSCQTFLNASVTLWPPNPKEFDSADRMLSRRAWFGQ